MSQVFHRYILILKKKQFIKKLVFFSKYGGRRPETGINVSFRLWNARLCMAQVFLHHISIKKKTTYKIFGFFYQVMVGKTCDMRKRAFQGPKRTFMHVSGLPPPYYGSKNQILYKSVLLSKYDGGRPETCRNVRFRLRNARLCMSQVFPHHFLKKKNQLL